MTVSVGTCVHLTIPVYMAVPGTFLSARFRVTDSVPAVFTYTRARFFRYPCVCVSCSIISSHALSACVSQQDKIVFKISFHCGSWLKNQEAMVIELN